MPCIALPLMAFRTVLSTPHVRPTCDPLRNCRLTNWVSMPAFTPHHTGVPSLLFFVEAMAGDWCMWDNMERIIQQENYKGGNSVFQNLKKSILKAQPSELDDICSRAPLVWKFLVNFVAVKDMWRQHTILIFHQLARSSAWMEAWERETELHEKIRSLPSDLQAALAAQHDLYKSVVLPGALGSIVRIEDSPQNVERAIQQEIITDSIKDASALLRSLSSTENPTSGENVGDIAMDVHAIMHSASWAKLAEKAGFSEECEGTVDQFIDCVDTSASGVSGTWRTIKVVPSGHVLYSKVGSDEATWERPTELGGPYQYALGDNVEVFSHRLQEWAPGEVCEKRGEVLSVVAHTSRGRARKEIHLPNQDIRRMDEVRIDRASL